MVGAGPASHPQEMRRRPRDVPRLGGTASITRKGSGHVVLGHRVVHPDQLRLRGVPHGDVRDHHRPVQGPEGVRLRQGGLVPRADLPAVPHLGRLPDRQGQRHGGAAGPQRGAGAASSRRPTSSRSPARHPPSRSRRPSRCSTPARSLPPSTSGSRRRRWPEVPLRDLGARLEGSFPGRCLGSFVELQGLDRVDGHRVPVLHRPDPAADPDVRGAPDGQRERRLRLDHPQVRAHRGRGAVGGAGLRPVGAGERGTRQPAPARGLGCLPHQEAAAAVPPGVRPASDARRTGLVQRGPGARRPPRARSRCCRSCGPSCGPCPWTGPWGCP